jgi:uncharacterized caspase-like protein
MQAAVRDFGERLPTDGVGLFYYAGHGLQVKGKHNSVGFRCARGMSP